MAQGVVGADPAVLGLRPHLQDNLDFAVGLGGHVVLVRGPGTEVVLADAVAGPGRRGGVRREDDVLDNKGCMKYRTSRVLPPPIYPLVLICPCVPFEAYPPPPSGCFLACF